MVNILIVSSNIDCIVSLINYINNGNKNAKICNIARNSEEINSESNIDLVIMDYSIYNMDKLMETINNKFKNVKVCNIVKNESVMQCRDNDLTTYKTNIDNILSEINKIEEFKSIVVNVEMKIIKELMYLGYPVYYKGTQYLIKAIYYIITNHNKDIDTLEKDVYKPIANMYNESVNNIKCRINRATDAMYYNCNMEKLKKYFYLDIDVKPKIKTIINTIINRILKSN